ncbi:hypothetical protein, partial [Pseudomonas amygdali]|uniref:hypothetical protein n=1 Tax=Pseudomonas amygdali TaxID=47877 RepID=UPI0039909597
SCHLGYTSTGTVVMPRRHIFTERQRSALFDLPTEGLDVPPELLAHISPLGWAHVFLTGEFLWPNGEKLR